jgi:hypothetical protein
MQSFAWISLLRRIPPDQHDILAIITTVGIEINVKDLLRIEEDHLVLRGRLAGTTDTGRVFFIPYSQINYLGYQKEVKVAQIMAIYGDGPEGQSSVPSSSQAASESAALSAEPVEAELAPVEASPEPEPAPPPDPDPPPQEPPKPATQLKIPRKSGLLERLRARAQAGTGNRRPTDP